MGPACKTAPTAVLALCSLLGLWLGLALLPGLFCWALLLAVQLVLRLCLGPAGAMPGLCQGYAAGTSIPEGETAEQHGH